MPRFKRRSRRSIRGGLIFLIAAVLLIVVLITFPLLFATIRVSIAFMAQHTANEAASLTAARCLSKIVINDSYFGYVSLSDYPPCGSGTTAGDGEPLPVIGINTLVATTRLDLLIAQSLGSADLVELAMHDVDESRRAAKDLQAHLEDAIKPDPKMDPRDIDGNSVRPYDDACEIFMTDLAGAKKAANLRVDSFQLKLGWLADGGSTLTRIPQPEAEADVRKDTQVKAKYKAFVDIPVGTQSFYFAGVSNQPSLVDSTKFRIADSKRISSIVRVESRLKIVTNGRAGISDLVPQDNTLIAAACAQPGVLEDASGCGVMSIFFSDGLVPGIRSMADILSAPQAQLTELTVQSVENGDFPNDSAARLVPSEEPLRTTSRLFAQGLFDWLRTAHGRPRIDSFVDAVHTSFDNGSTAREGLYYFFDVDKNGNVRVTSQRLSPFATQTVFDRQLYGLSFQGITFGDNAWTVTCRDEVNKLGPIAGGKHAGQTMPGDPVNWCDLANYGGGTDVAKAKGRGVSLGMKVLGDETPEDGITLDTAFFAKLDGRDLSHQPRKSYYAGGLAVEFRISSPTERN